MTNLLPLFPGISCFERSQSGLQQHLHWKLNSVPLSLTGTIYSLLLLPHSTCSFLSDSGSSTPLVSLQLHFCGIQELIGFAYHLSFWAFILKCFFNVSCSSICPLFLSWLVTFFVSCCLFLCPLCYDHSSSCSPCSPLSILVFTLLLNRNMNIKINSFYFMLKYYHLTIAILKSQMIEWSTMKN